jgi:putative DNA primase/helicase
VKDKTMDSEDDLVTAIENNELVTHDFMTFGPFAMTDEGLTKGVTIKNGKAKITQPVKVAAPFVVIGYCRNPDGEAWGKTIRFRDADGRLHTRHVADITLHSDPSKLAGEIGSGGLHIDRKYQKEFAEYLNKVAPPDRVTHVDRTGWHEIHGKRVFVLPEETIGADALGETVVLDDAEAGNYERKGSLAEWQAGVGALAVGHPWMIFAISAALAGALAHLVGAEGGGVHFVGRSSIGKSRLVAAAASVWGRGETGGNGYVRTWRATANGMEGAAARATHTLLALDELGVGDPREVAAAVYAIANGTGKQRARRDGSAQAPRTWNVMIISSGEVSVETKIEEDRGRKARAGQTVRLLDIPADRGLGHGVFDTPGAFADAGKLADAVKTAATAAYGTAGPAFVRGIIEHDPDKVSSWAQDVIEKFVQKHATAGASEQVGRVARKLGLIAAAGELAIALGVAAWTRGDAWNAAALGFDAWIKARGGSGPHEERQAIEQVRLVIEKHGDARFERLTDAKAVGLPTAKSALGLTSLTAHPVANRLGWRRGTGKDELWFITPEAWKTEVCSGLDPVAVAKTLAKHGMMKLPKGGRHLSRRVRIDGRPTRVYVVTALILT